MSRPPARRRPHRARRRSTAGLLLVGRLLRAAIALTALVALVGGLPWALWHFVGWPLPHEVPTWEEVSARLTGPMDDTLLLDVLAVLLWPLWFAFAVSVALAVPEVVREARWPGHGVALPVGGMRGFATFLLGAVLLTVVQSRGPLTPASGPATTTAAATAPVTPSFVTVATATPIETALPTAAPGTAVVQLPANGVYDSLWRIADRCLGDGARWPEIWALNHGVAQADGRALTQPGLIRPGWVLSLPSPPPAVTPPGDQAPSSPPTTPPSGQAPASPAPSTPPTTVSPPATSQPATPTPTASTPTPGGAAPPPTASPSTGPASPTPTTVPPTTPAAPSTHPSAPAPPRAPGVTFPSGGYLGLGAVALLVVALFSMRLWRRRHYVPGSGVRDDLDEPPVIRQLAVAYNAATAERDADGELVVVRPPGDPHITGRRHATATATAHAAPPGTRVVGTTGDGQPLALDLAATRGLGLIGPGADAAIRALLVALLADRHQPAAGPVEVLIPAADVRRLLGEGTTAAPPQRLHVVADLATLLDRLEADVVTRARRAAAGEDPSRSTLVVIAAPDQTSDRRLQAVLDNGSPLGVVGILYGQWRPGATARVRPDGVVGAASPDIAAALTGNRLFTLPEAATTDLLDLLADADAPATNQEEFRRANPTQGPPPPPPASAPPPSSAPPAPADVDSPSEAQRRLEPDEPPPGGGGAAATEADEAPPPPPSAPAVAVPAASPRAPEVTTPLLLTLFGRWQLSYRPTPDSEPHTVEGIGIKGRELVAYLAAHTGWVRRDTLIEAVWPDDGEPRHRIDNRFYAALSPLRRALRRATDGAIDDLFEQNEGRWRLRTDLLTVDLWQIQDALEARRRATTTAQEIAAILPLTGLYTGHLATDLTGTWAEPPREHLRRQVTDALTSILASLSEATPERLDLLDTLRRLDPINEQIYCQIARTQAHLGHHDALTVTYGQLVDALADLDQRPSADTDRLFQELMRGPQNSRSA